MRSTDIIRAWKDPEYRRALTEAERVLMPDHPAGLIDLTDAELDVAAGGQTRLTQFQSGCRSIQLL